MFVSSKYSQLSDVLRQFFNLFLLKLQFLFKFLFLHHHFSGLHIVSIQPLYLTFNFLPLQLARKQDCLQLSHLILFLCAQHCLFLKATLLFIVQQIRVGGRAVNSLEISVIRIWGNVLISMVDDIWADSSACPNCCGLI